MFYDINIKMEISNMMHSKTAAAVEEVIRMVADGQLAEDGYLPSICELAERLSIGRGAVPSLLAELAARGITDRAAGRHIRLVANLPGTRHCRKILVPLSGIPLPEDKGHAKGNMIREFTEVYQALTGVLAAGEEAGLEIIPRLHPPAITAEGVVNRCRNDGFDGVICIESFPAGLPQAMERAGIPLVIANHESPEPACSSGMDFRQVGRFAGRTLIEAGHHRIGFFSGPRNSAIYREMFAGFKGALAEDDLEVHPENFAHLEYGWGLGHWENTVKAMLRMRNRPTAIFVCRDRRAAAVFAAAAAVGLRIPEDLSVLGYDNLTWPEGKIHGLTTIEQPAVNIGRAAVFLVQQYFKTGIAPASVRLPPGPLVRRTSLGPPPSRVAAGLAE